MFRFLVTQLSARLPRNEKGQDLAEYALLIGLIALAVVGAVTLLGDEISATFDAIGVEIGTWAVPAP